MKEWNEGQLKEELSKMKQDWQGRGLPEFRMRSEDIPHAPRRVPGLSKGEQRRAVANALRYFRSEWHRVLGQEFLVQLREYGHIYMYRWLPDYRVKAYPQEWYPCVSVTARCIMHNIMNNLSREVAQFPQQLITYGGNGGVFSNWAQYHLTLYYLSQLNEQQTLVLASGHPQGLFPSGLDSPRLILTNGMMVPNFSQPQLFDKLYAMGCTQFGQMTAGSFCYIGSQGIVHGTTLTLLNACRLYLKKQSMKGVLYISSGLGGMSGAQPKAADICGCVSVTAEINQSALNKRFKQGWVTHKITNIEELVIRVKEAKIKGITASFAYLGNIVEVWERFAQELQLTVELGSDQTSLHNPYGGGYYPIGLSTVESEQLMLNDPVQFKGLVHRSLLRQVTAINILASRGMHFWDYGNSFLFMAAQAGADIFHPTIGLSPPEQGGVVSKQRSCVSLEDGQQFRYPSYVEDIMGNIFELGFGPFRWICTSGKRQDLKQTDCIAQTTIRELIEKCPLELKPQYQDNLRWIQQAQYHNLVVGSQARILYADAIARQLLMERFSLAVESGELSGPVILSRDHHDVSGTDSPFRETSSIKDGSKFCADMSVHNFVGGAIRGASWVALHNGGGTGWGQAINGGHGVVLEGIPQQRQRLRHFMLWDVANGVARRHWAGGHNAQFYSRYLMETHPQLKITQPHHVDHSTLSSLFH